jgi:hypothetical protein
MLELDIQTRKLPHEPVYRNDLIVRTGLVTKCVIGHLPLTMGRQLGVRR